MQTYIYKTSVNIGYVIVGYVTYADTSFVYISLHLVISYGRMF